VNDARWDGLDVAGMQAPMDGWIAFHREEHLPFEYAQTPPGPLGDTMIALQRVR
jgi:hypothetical protein